jgi:hypothetical protein
MKLEYSKRSDPRQKTPGHYAGYVARKRSRSRSYRRRRSTSSESFSRSQRRYRLYIYFFIFFFFTSKEITIAAEAAQEEGGDPTPGIEGHPPTRTPGSTVERITLQEVVHAAEEEIAIRDDIDYIYI